jgi:AmmeMemoRadiSam system protein B/AmmeMemoRadiSam system protein A
MATVHASPFSGVWYPGEPAQLRNLLDDLFEKSSRRTGPYLLPDPVAFVVPHAGLAYSGTVAASVYRHLQALQPKRVIILGFCHRGSEREISLPDVEGFATPLGEVSVDRETVAQLAGQTPFRLVPERRLCDHSVEIQLPLLQRAVPDARIAPLYVGHLTGEQRGAAAAALAQLATPGTVFLASSDFTHYGRSFYYQPFPADEKAAERLRALDHSVIDYACSLDPRMFLDHITSTGSTVCGFAPIGLLLALLGHLEGEDVFQQELDYQTSGEITQDFEHSVSYAALGYFAAKSFTLNPEDQLLLLESARATLRHYRTTGERRPIPPRRPTPALTRCAGVFVTLRRDGLLCGCIGNHCARQPLAAAVPELALSAALDDPRFSPLAAIESAPDIEISVLSPLKRIQDAGRFRLNQHGACLEYGLYRSLLLPQVAAGRNWTAEQFLEALAAKAGLGPHAYREAGAALYVFRAQVFGAHGVISWD